jgi:hypothetical protein
MSASDEPGRREVAHRLFAAEYDDATLQYSESDEERAPNYVVTPTGARVNRLFLVGVLTEVEQVNPEVLRARIVDPTGAFVVYAGQYQPDELAFLERTDPPAFVAVTGKARTFEPDDGDRVYTSVRPESINVVDAATRDRWVVQTAEHTLDRVATTATATAMDVAGDELTAALRERGVRDDLATGIPLALEHYGTGAAYLDALRTAALDAARVVADERDEVRSPDLAPDATRTEAPDVAAIAKNPPGRLVRVGETGSESDADTRAEREIDVETETEPAPETGTGPESEPAAEPELEAESEPEPAAQPESEPESEPEAESEPETEPVAGAESDLETEPESDLETEPESDLETEPESEPEPEPRPEPDVRAGAGEDDDGGTTENEDLGDFEGRSLSEGDADSSETVSTDEMYELDEEERREIEEEYGTEFETGTEVDEPGAAEMEAPEPTTAAETEGASSEPATPSDPTASPESADTPESTEPIAEEPETEAGEGATETDAETETGTDAESTADSAGSEDATVDEVLLDAMRALDDGDGAEREAVIADVSEATGADRETIEDAIQDALMGGQCYEPSDGRLKPI